MKKLIYLGLTTFFISGIAVASPGPVPNLPCDQLQLRLKNNLDDDLLITEIKLKGASIQPNTVGKLTKKSEQVFVIKQDIDNGPMDGVISLHTASLPMKTVRIRYGLKNTNAICEHNDYSPSRDFLLEYNHSVGEIQYAINYK